MKRRTLLQTGAALGVASSVGLGATSAASAHSAATAKAALNGIDMATNSIALFSSQFAGPGTNNAWVTNVLHNSRDTYWQSAAGAPVAQQFITVDLQAVHGLSTVNLTNQSVTASGRLRGVTVELRRTLLGAALAAVNAELPDSAATTAIAMPAGVQARYVTVRVRSVWSGAAANLAMIESAGYRADVFAAPAHLALVAGATAAGSLGGYLFDGNPQTAWVSAQGVPQTFVIDLGHVGALKWLRWGTRATGSPKALAISTSVDAITWSAAENLTTLASDTSHRHLFAAPREGRFIRFEVASVHSGNAVELTSIEPVYVPRVTALNRTTIYSRLAVMGDSLTFQYSGASARIVSHLTESGWHQNLIRVDGVSGRAIFSSDVKPTTQEAVTSMRGSGYNGGTWLMALGTNNWRDSYAVVRGEFLKMLQLLGPGHKVYLLDMGFYRPESTEYSIDLSRPIGERYVPAAPYSHVNAAMYNLRDEQLAGRIDNTVYAELVAVLDWNHSPRITPRAAEDWNAGGGSYNDDGSWVHNTQAAYEKRDAAYAGLVDSAK